MTIIFITFGTEQEDQVTHEFTNGENLQEALKILKDAKWKLEEITSIIQRDSDHYTTGDLVQAIETEPHKLNKYQDAVLWTASKAKDCHRSSVTQYHWTEQGLERLKALK